MPRAKKSSKQAKLQRVLGQTTFGSTKVESAESDNVSEYDPSDNDETLSEDEDGGTLDSITTHRRVGLATEVIQLMEAQMALTKAPEHF